MKEKELSWKGDEVAVTYLSHSCHEQAQEQVSMEFLRVSIRVQLISIASWRIYLKKSTKHAYFLRLLPLLFLPVLVTFPLRSCCGIFLPWWPTKLEDVSMMPLYLCGLWRRLARRRGQVVMMRKNKVGDPKVQECIYLRNQNDQHNQHMGRGMHEQVCWYCLQQRMVSHLIGVLQVKQLILSREDRRCWWYMKMMQVIWIRLCSTERGWWW